MDAIINSIANIVSLITAFLYLKNKADITLVFKQAIKEADEMIKQAEKDLVTAEKANDLQAYKRASNLKQDGEKQKQEAEKQLEEAEKKSFKDADYIHGAILYCRTNKVLYTLDDLKHLVFDVCHLHSMGQFQGYTDRQLAVLEAAGLEVTVKPKQAEKTSNKSKNN